MTGCVWVGKMVRPVNNIKAMTLSEFWKDGNYLKLLIKWNSNVLVLRISNMGKRKFMTDKFEISPLLKFNFHYPHVASLVLCPSESHFSIFRDIILRIFVLHREKRCLSVLRNVICTPPQNRVNLTCTLKVLEFFSWRN